MARRIARVLIDSPLPQLDRLFDYAVPESLAESITPGVRVKVPLRTLGRVVEGYVVELDTEESIERPLSDIDEVPSAAVVMPDRTYQLARRVADRAAGSANDILRLVIPKRQVRVEKTWLAAEPPVACVPTAEALASAEALVGEFPGLHEHLTSNARIALDAPARPDVLSNGSSVGAWARMLAAAAVITLAAGRSTVVVVPDHRDQDELARALDDVLPAEAIVRVDARQSNPERYRSFLRTLDEAPCVVIGNRSAVYSPVHAGLVIIWDDGDSLLDEQLAPYVHARDAALVRQELQGHGLIIAGHTRSADAERLVRIGYLSECVAARRYTPRVVLSSTSETERPGVRVPSAAFRAARDALAENGPVLVQVSRPGYAPVLVCADCRRPAKCAHCAGPLFARSRGAAPLCRWCGRTAHGWKCPTCESERVRLASSGSERTADELGRAFPGVRIIVADGDHPVARVDAAPALVIATRGAEPPAEGGYRAILLLDGDKMLMADDLRIAESCLRWWSNAAALAAPMAPIHLVSVTGAVARALATWTQPAFALSELSERAPLRMPPTVRVAVLDGDADRVDAAITALRDAVPTLPAEAIVGPVSTEVDDFPTSRALVRFDYAQGSAVSASLRASVVAAALRSRRGRGRNARTTLKVRLDVADPQL